MAWTNPAIYITELDDPTVSGFTAVQLEVAPNGFLFADDFFSDIEGAIIGTFEFTERNGVMTLTGVDTSDNVDNFIFRIDTVKKTMNFAATSKGVTHISPVYPFFGDIFFTNLPGQQTRPTIHIDVATATANATVNTSPLTASTSAVRPA